MGRGAPALAQEAIDDPAGVVARWRAGHDGPVVAHLPYDVPAELIHAAGALPVGVFPAGAGGEYAEGHLQGWICSPARRFLAAAQRGELDWADGLIVPQICDTMRALKGLWQHLKGLPFLEAYRLPRTTRPSALPYLAAELGRLADRLAGFTGRAFDPAALAASIALYNTLRRRLTLLFERHARGELTNLTWYSLVRAGFVLPPAEMADLLDAADGLQEAAAGVPVVLSGQLMEPPALAGLLDAAGLLAVGDDLVDGRRACQPAAEAGDPLKALAGRTLGDSPCAVKDGPVPRETYLAGLVRESGARGVIFVHFRNCEIENLGYPGLRDSLERQGIPTLYLETQWGAAAGGALATRLEAFREIVEGC